MGKRSAALGALVALATVLAACGDDQNGTTARESGESAAGAAGQVDPDDVVDLDGDEVHVRAQDNEFVEPNIRVAVGTTVTWANEGRQDHDVIPAGNGGGWGVGVDDFGPGDVYEHTFDEPGTYRYYCTLHGTEDVGMIGAVVVE